MLTNLFTWFSTAIFGSPAIAICAAFVWGILSVLLSPCHISSIPLIIGFINKKRYGSIRSAFSLSILFAIGILITIALIGLITASLGRLLGDIGNTGNYIIAVVFLAVGLYLLDIIRFDWDGFHSDQTSGNSWLAAFVLGLIFGIGLGPCTFAFMAPMLGIVFQTASTQLLLSIALLLAFASGHSIIIVMAGTLAEKVQIYLNWTEKTKGTILLRKTCGVLVIFSGIYIIFK
ncbi:cytochrome C biogenesis protein [candidate division KSB1 bacterium]|nr:cytochrome C biogenesis protein [candidate division KSB1 bacterium]